MPTRVFPLRQFGRLPAWMFPVNANIITHALIRTVAP